MFNFGLKERHPTICALIAGALIAAILVTGILYGSALIMQLRERWLKFIGELDGLYKIYEPVWLVPPPKEEPKETPQKQKKKQTSYHDSAQQSAVFCIEKYAYLPR